MNSLPYSPIFASLWTRELFGCPISHLASLVLIQTVQGVVKTGFKDLTHPSRHEPPPLTSVGLELAKCIVTLAFLYRDAKALKIPGSSYVSVSLDETLPLYSTSSDELEVHAPDHSDNEPLPHRPTRHLYLTLGPLACLYLLRYQLTVSRPQYANHATLDSADSLVILFVGLHTYILVARTTPLRHWTSALLQISAVCVVHRVIKVPQYSLATYALLLLGCALSSFILVATSTVYQTMRDVSFHKMNLVLFSTCLAGYVISAVLSSAPYPQIIAPNPHPRDLIASGVILGLRIVGEILTLAILRRTFAFTLSVITLLSASLIPPFSHTWLASALALYAALSYLIDSPAESPASMTTSAFFRPRRTLMLVGLTFAPLLVMLAFNPPKPIPYPAPFVWSNATGAPERLMPHQFDPTYNLTQNTSCVRRPLPSSSVYVGPGTRPDFHAFDDVLLVVFFSHDRYDINLDGYREVYSPYFPNTDIVIGPASREDRGFMHSYDVVLDSYHSYEDFDADWFKMGGRMAHHMFYTVVKDNPCYAGYLWAPFDTLLNVPRLMQFPQDRIWYHSPFAQHYVPNPAGVMKHPPPAKIAQRSPREYAHEAGAWGAGWTWWWGEKHVGLEVCIPAYDRVPPQMRARIEDLVGMPGHLIGGSADTMYVPGQLHADLLDVLGTFLQTDCFLEIALPTTLHLIVPEGQEIVWVDHWWNHPPPCNTTFVRDLWADGYEVDSFHSFHWGDIQDDGVFGPNQNTVVDMRALFSDSFERQGIVPPSELSE
ncbi:hypothetical protein DFH09DRAFT_1374069 [Mycena vulgaris]|nr:hypothetical protein DFH09DRAFT_1374069 [Mycena vulgaris]